MIHRVLLLQLSPILIVISACAPQATAPASIHPAISHRRSLRPTGVPPATATAIIVPSELGAASAVPETTPTQPIWPPTEFGIQINGCDRNVDDAMKLAQYMGLAWIKQQVRWGDMATPGHLDWSCLDRVVPAAHRAGFKVLLSVTTAPAHMRLIGRDTLGPPDRFEWFGEFIYTLVARYRGQVQAIEMWNEPNLAIEWHDTIDGAKYAQLLAVGYGAAKLADPSILVISAGLSPTPHDGPWTHVGDVSFFSRMVEYNALAQMDCIGAHANGPEGVGEIDLVAPRYYGLAGRARPVCVTEFGYGLPVEGRAPSGFDWVMAHTMNEQATKFADWIQWAKQSGMVRLAIIWNLNFDGPARDPNAPYALVRPGWVSPAAEVIRRCMLESC